MGWNGLNRLKVPEHSYKQFSVLVSGSNEEHKELTVYRIVELQNYKITKLRNYAVIFQAKYKINLFGMFSLFINIQHINIKHRAVRDKIELNDLYARVHKVSFMAANYIFF